MTNSSFPNDLLETLLELSGSGSTVFSPCSAFSDLQSAMGPHKVSGIKRLTINIDKGDARKQDRGPWCSSVMEGLSSITEALNSVLSATRKKGGGR